MFSHFSIYSHSVLLIVCHCESCFLVTIGHKESVIGTSFSSNGSYLATGDMSGLIQVWKTESQQCIKTADVDELEVSSARTSSLQII